MKFYDLKNKVYISIYIEETWDISNRTISFNTKHKLKTFKYFIICKNINKYIQIDLK